MEGTLSLMTWWRGRPQGRSRLFAGSAAVVLPLAVVGCSAPTPSCDPCAAPSTSRPPDPATTDMAVRLLVGGELPEDDLRALMAGTSRPCPTTIHRPGNRLGLAVGSVVTFTPVEPAYGHTLPPTATPATVTVNEAVTAFIYAGPHLDPAGQPVGAGCRFTGHGVIPNAATWMVRLPDGTTINLRAGTGPSDELGATLGSG